MLKLAHPRIWIAGGCLIAVAIIVGSLIPGSDVAAIGVNDKVEHVGAYLLLTLWLSGVVERRNYLWVAVLALALGGGLEIAQGVFTTTRDPDWFDFAADGAGAAGAFVLAWAGLGGWARWIEGVLGLASPG